MSNNRAPTQGRALNKDRAPTQGRDLNKNGQPIQSGALNKDSTPTSPSSFPIDRRQSMRNSPSSMRSLSNNDQTPFRPSRFNRAPQNVGTSLDEKSNINEPNNATVNIIKLSYTDRTYFKFTTKRKMLASL